MGPENRKKAPISMDYGFLVDDNNKVIRLKREYGFSYPVLFRSTGSTSFQGCRTPVMLDFLLVYEDGSITVSSSDDWLKQE